MTAIQRHELLHLAAGALALADRHPVSIYAQAEAWFAANDEDGEAAVHVASLDDDELTQIAAVTAAGPLADVPNATALVRAADSRLAACGLSPADVRLLRRWRGSTRAMERLVGATTRLAGNLALDRIGKALVKADVAPVPLSWIVPRTRAVAALQATDAAFRARQRDPQRAPTYAA